jgi:hypothetical protein
MSATVHEARFSRDASNVSYAAKLHQVEIRARKNCIRGSREGARQTKRKSPATAGLVDVRSDRFTSIASRDKLN